MSDKQPIHPLLLGTTPGPWRISRSNPCAINTDQGGDSISIADARGYDNPLFASREQAPFNAKLIAQAPALAAENAALAEQVDRLRAMVDRAAGLAGLSPWVADPPMKELLLKFCADARDLLSKYK